MRDGTLAGKRALVTGAGIGIGAGIAQEFAQQSAHIALHYAFDTEYAPRLADEINASGGRALAIKGDLTRVEQCQRIVDEAVHFLGGLDILVNNAGVTLKSAFFDTTAEMFDHVCALNIRGYYFCAQQAGRTMAERGGGSIINIASIHAFGGMPGLSAYAASKGAVVALTRELAIELLPHRIRVNAIGPGHIEVERHRADPNYVRAVSVGRVPWGRAGEPADIAKTAAFLASDAADFIVGQVLYVDGGLTAKLAM